LDIFKTKGSGKVQVQNRQKLNGRSTSLFEIGSISKSFTGIVAAQLSLEKNKFDLTLPISTYVPELGESFVGSVTSIQLGTHSAQLVNNLLDSTGQISKLFSEAELISFLKSYAPDLSHYPKGQRHYSNLGFATLGLVISRIEKKYFAAIIQERILDVLRMKNTGFLISTNRPAGLLQGYNVVLEPLDYEPSSDLQIASGGIYSDLADMTAYLEANLYPESSSLEQAINLSHQLGLGWDSQPADTITWKNGAMPAGFSSLLKFDRTKKEGVIVMANDLNIAATMHVSDIALDVQPPLYSYVDMPVLVPTISEVVGSYFADDGKLELEVVFLGSQYLGIYFKNGFLRNGPESYYKWRLMQQSVGVFLVNNGVTVSDAAVVHWNPVSQKMELVYASFVGYDANNKPIYENKAFQK
jgi:CubicO group peptidase (beta-lactamase class C family)